MAARMPPSAIYREGFSGALFKGRPPALVLVLGHFPGLQLVERAPPCREGGAQFLGALRLGVECERLAVHGLEAEGVLKPEERLQRLARRGELVVVQGGQRHPQGARQRCQGLLGGVPQAQLVIADGGFREADLLREALLRQPLHLPIAPYALAPAQFDPLSFRFLSCASNSITARFCAQSLDSTILC